MKPYHLCLLLFFFSCTNKTPEPPTQKTTIPIRTTPVKEQQIRTTIYTSGKTINRHNMQLSFKVSGLISNITVREGDTVTAQDTLAMLDQTEIRAHHTQAITTYEKAYRDHQRAQRLQNENVMTTNQLLSAKVALEAARTARDIATHNLTHATIIAPTNGRILKKYGETNEIIGAGTPLFAFASNTATTSLRAGITDRDILFLTLGDSATVTFDAHTGMQIPARVEEIAATADPHTGLFEIELALNTQHTLLPGMIGQARIHTQHSQPRLVIPVEALIDADSDRGFVYVHKDNVVYRRAVTLDKLLGNTVLIKQGISLGEQIVTDGASYLRDQSQVTITKEKQ